MDSIVLELQREALDKAVAVTDLLRKAYVVAKKLKIPELAEWINNELNGYGETKKVPTYRNISGHVKAWNPYHGWQPVVFQDAEMEKILSSRACGQTIAELEDMVKERSPDGTFHMPFSSKILNQLRRAIHFDTEITLITDRTSLVRILDAVRNIILNWAMKLEEDGILGEGYTFSQKEKHEVEKHSYNINNFFGSVEGAQIQQGTIGSSQIQELDLGKVELLLSEIRKHIGSLGLTPPVEEETVAELDTIETQMRSPRPKTLIIKESLRSIRTILEGAGGDLAAELLKQIGPLF